MGAALASELEGTSLYQRTPFCAVQAPGSGRTARFPVSCPCCSCDRVLSRTPPGWRGWERGSTCPHPLLLTVLEAHLRLSLRAPQAGPQLVLPMGPWQAPVRVQGSAPQFPSAPPCGLDGHSGGRPVTAGGAQGSRQEGREERVPEPCCPSHRPTGRGCLLWNISS